MLNKVLQWQKRTSDVRNIVQQIHAEKMALHPCTTGSRLRLLNMEPYSANFGHRSLFIFHQQQC